MSIVKSIKCRMGNHEWGAWEYLSHEPPVPKNCERQRTCANCQLVEKTAEETHDWQAWSYVADKSCDQERICKRCQSKEIRKPKHDMGAWKYTAGDSCDQERVCRRCSVSEKREAEHEWGAWEGVDDPTKQMRVCGRCKEEEIREKPSFLASCYPSIVEPREQDSFYPMDIRVVLAADGLMVAFAEDMSKLDRFTRAGTIGMYHWLNSQNNTEPFLMPYEAIEAVNADFYEKKGNVTQFVETAKGKIKSVGAGRELRLRLLYRNQAKGTKLKVKLNIKDQRGAHSNQAAIDFYNALVDELG